MTTLMTTKRRFAASHHWIVLLGVLSTTSLADGQISKVQTLSLDGERVVLDPAGAVGISGFDHGDDVRIAKTAAAVLREADAQPNSAAAVASNVAFALSSPPTYAITPI
jgi:threonine dehydratase